MLSVSESEPSGIIDFEDESLNVSDVVQNVNDQAEDVVIQDIFQKEVLEYLMNSVI